MRSRVRSLAAALAGGVVLVGCANVPDHGDVHPGNAVPQANTGEEETVRVIVHGPSPGDKPEDIVTGFLTASAGSETDHSVARTYLTLQAARTWQPNARALVYDGTPTSDAGPARTLGSARAVLFRVPLAATVGSDGGYTNAARGALLQVDFRLVQQRGEWRIANPPPGLLLTTDNLNRALN